jgi:hypothetical protein
MAPNELYIIGIDPGGTTGTAVISIPRLSIFPTKEHREPSGILAHTTQEFAGSESEQATNISRYIRTIQSLTYQIGPAVVCEDWDNTPEFKNRDDEPYSPLRIGAMLTYLYEQTPLLGDATLTFQSRALAKSDATDERLKAWGLYRATRGSDHNRDATRHAVTALRRAASNRKIARAMWPHADV